MRQNVLSLILALSAIAIVDPGVVAARGQAPSTVNASADAVRLNNLGVASMNQQKFEIALKYFEDAAARDASFSLAKVNQSIALLALQRYELAEQLLEALVKSDDSNVRAWYNLGLVRMSRGDSIGSHFAFARTVHYKPGHSAALFQLGLMEEKRNHQRAAIDYYAKAFLINHSLLDVRVNPRILDSKLVDMALLKVYANEHARQSMSFQPAPPGYVQQSLEAPSTQPSAQQIVTPSLPLTDPSQQAPPPTPGMPLQPAPQPAKPPL